MFLLSSVLAVIAALLPLGGLVAKGLGAIAIIFALGAIVGVMLTVMVTSRIRRLRHR